MIDRLKRFIRIRPFTFICILYVIYLILFGALNRADIQPKLIIHTGLDDMIPFCRYMVVPYFFWHPEIAAVILFTYFRRSTGEFLRSSLTMLVCMMCALVIYRIIPTGIDMRPAVVPGHDIFARLTEFLYAIDPPRNVCPSLHVAICCLMNEIWLRNLPGKWWWAPTAINLLIIASILFVKQHSVIDIGAGILYALIFSILQKRILPSR